MEAKEIAHLVLCVEYTMYFSNNQCNRVEYPFPHHAVRDKTLYECGACNSHSVETEDLELSVLAQKPWFRRKIAFDGN